MYPELEGGFFTTEPLGKPEKHVLKVKEVSSIFIFLVNITKGLLIFVNFFLQTIFDCIEFSSIGFVFYFYYFCSDIYYFLPLPALSFLCSFFFSNFLRWKDKSYLKFFFYSSTSIYPTN